VIELDWCAIVIIAFSPGCGKRWSKEFLKKEAMLQAVRKSIRKVLWELL
jgi:hypothetical protein